MDLIVEPHGARTRPILRRPKVAERIRAFREWRKPGFTGS
jgi:hypothetical protein